MELHMRTKVRIVTEIYFSFYSLSKNNKSLTTVWGPLIVPPFMNFRVVYGKIKACKKCSILKLKI